MHDNVWSESWGDDMNWGESETAPLEDACVVTTGESAIELDTLSPACMPEDADWRLQSLLTM